MKMIMMIIVLNIQIKIMSHTKENFFQDINPSSEMVEAASNQEQEVKKKSLLQRLKQSLDVSCFGDPVEWQKNERNERKLPF